MRSIDTSVYSEDAFCYHRNDEYYLQWNAAWDTARDSCLGKYPYLGIQDAMTYSHWAIKSAILALVAYPDCAYMLDSDPSELELLVKLSNDDTILLMLPACRLLNDIKKEEK